jgi:hypothetical protein
MDHDNAHSGAEHRLEQVSRSPSVSHSQTFHTAKMKSAFGVHSLNLHATNACLVGQVLLHS